MKRQLIAAAALALLLQTPLTSQTRQDRRSLKKNTNQVSRTGHASQKPKPRPNLATEPTLYVVGYAHLDTEWRWEYPQTINEYLPKTMRNNFAFLDRKSTRLNSSHSQISYAVFCLKKKKKKKKKK